MFHIRKLVTRRTILPRIVSATEAVDVIPSGSKIYLHGVACTPMLLLDALNKRNISNIEFIHLHLEGRNPCYSRPNDFSSSCFFIGKDQRDHVANGHGSYIPSFLSELGNLMRSRYVVPDVALIQVSTPDKHGYVSLGPEVAAALPAVETAKLVIAQVNKKMPRTWGRGNIHMSCIDYAVNASEALFAGHATPIGPVERKIGQNIASLVRDGATLQMGIGAIPDAVLDALKNHKDLGIHTEMLGEGFLPLLKSGAVTNARKHYKRDRSVVSFALGSPELYGFIDDNPSIYFDESGTTNNPSIIARNDHVVAVNSCVEMDLTGQACADSVGTRMISGVGGQLDFIRGAALSKDGVPVLCFPSIAANGSSKIVAELRPGSGVVTTRPHVHWVVTEYGAVNLCGKNLHERARLLISIAHPSKRAELEAQAFNRYKIRAWKSSNDFVPTLL